MLNVMLNKFATASSHIGRRAIVIGAGVSGLSAANALADHFEEVIVLERDELPYGYIRIVGYGRHIRPVEISDGRQLSSKSVFRPSEPQPTPLHTCMIWSRSTAFDTRPIKVPCSISLSACFGAINVAPSPTTVAAAT